MNTMRQRKESLLNNCPRTGPVRYAAHRKMHLRRYLKQHKEKAMAFNRGDFQYYIPVLRDRDIMLHGINSRRRLKQPGRVYYLYLVSWLYIVVFIFSLVSIWAASLKASFLFSNSPIKTLYTDALSFVVPLCVKASYPLPL